MKETILLVDDDDGFRKSISTMLSLEDYNIIEAENGKEAIRLLEQHDIDLILSDVLMPELDGIEFSSFLKKSSYNKKVIGMSGGGRLGDAEKMENLTQGFFTYFLQKPISRQELLDCIEQSLN